MDILKWLFTAFSNCYHKLRGWVKRIYPNSSFLEHNYTLKQFLIKYLQTIVKKINSIPWYCFYVNISRINYYLYYLNVFLRAHTYVLIIFITRIFDTIKIIVDKLTSYKCYVLMCGINIKMFN